MAKARAQGITRAMNRPLPLLAVILGVAGLIPFCVMGYLALGGEAQRAGVGLVAYGAVILAFLGGVHWGFALQDEVSRSERSRLILGVTPSLVGWVAVLFTIALNVEAALGLLIIGFVGTTIVEARARAAGLIPRGYMGLRYGMSAAVVTVLVLVLLLRLIGAHTNS